MAFLSPFFLTFLQDSSIFILTTPAYSLLVCSRALFIKAVSLSLAQPPLSFSTSVCSLILLILHFQQPRIFIDWPRRFVTTNNCFLSLFFYLQLVFFLHHIHESSWLFSFSFFKRLLLKYIHKRLQNHWFLFSILKAYWLIPCLLC
jgi:hypothetical protein